jgi:hypothetical protein
MKGMFWGAKSFNQYLMSWDVSNVTDMNYMFYEATSFKQFVGGWNVDKVITSSSTNKIANPPRNFASPEYMKNFIALPLRWRPWINVYADSDVTTPFNRFTVVHYIGDLNRYNALRYQKELSVYDWYNYKYYPDRAATYTVFSAYSSNRNQTVYDGRIIIKTYEVKGDGTFIYKEAWRITNKTINIKYSYPPGLSKSINSVNSYRYPTYESQTKPNYYFINQTNNGNYNLGSIK